MTFDRDHDVVIDEVGLVGIVRQDAADLCRGKKNILRPFPFKERFDLGLPPKVQFLRCPEHQVRVALFAAAF